MSVPNTVEGNLLRPAERVLDSVCGCLARRVAIETRVQLLEEVSSLIGGFDSNIIFNREKSSSRKSEMRSAAKDIAGILKALPFNPSLGLAALARSSETRSRRRASGSYYTDFRLAYYLASLVQKKRPAPVLDPACGSGTLLIAVALKLSGGDPKAINRLLGDFICGADLCVSALRCAFLALASLSDDESVLKKLRLRLRLADSVLSGLATWDDVAPNGFELVIGNPPWEKLKLTRHEWRVNQGENRHYGDDYSHSREDKALMAARANLARYIQLLETKFHLQGRGEYDLFKLFCELSFRLTAPSGEIALLLPAGLIRSQGTEELRKWLIESSDNTEIAVIENRARFFEIDTRFKFLAIHASLHPKKSNDSVSLLQTTATPGYLTTQKSVRIPKAILRRIRPDFSIPEVRSAEEWRLFSDLCRKGAAFADPGGPWAPRFMREIDMTRERSLFLRGESCVSSVPLIEGRMVHQYRYAAKRYVRGTGRRAVWEPTTHDDPASIRPQFRFPREALPSLVTERVLRWRVGFCDITGQTNERTMLASRIPAGVVCGNKVPTIVFECAPDNENLAYCWLAIVNSFLFDWMLRRVVTTTVNYFLLESLPLPKFDPICSISGRRLATLSRSLSEEGQYENLWAKAERRAEIETLVLSLFGRDTKDMETILTDFPLLDRAQPALQGETHSSITKDLVLLRAAESLNGIPNPRVNQLRERLESARELGAVPFVPSHLAADYE